MLLLVGFLAVQDQVVGVYVNVHALNANGGRTGDGQRIIEYSSNTNKIILKPFVAGRDSQVWDMTEVPDSNKFHLYLRCSTFEQMSSIKVGLLTLKEK